MDLVPKLMEFVLEMRLGAGLVCLLLRFNRVKYHLGDGLWRDYPRHIPCATQQRSQKTPSIKCRNTEILVAVCNKMHEFCMKNDELCMKHDDFNANAQVAAPITPALGSGVLGSSPDFA